VTAVGCASAAPRADTAAQPPPRAERIAELEQSIAEDHTTLQQLITRPREPGEAPLHSDPTLKAIARRLGEQERELESLLEEQAANDPSVRTR
jgi:hypothetical protein